MRDKRQWRMDLMLPPEKQGMLHSALHVCTIKHVPNTYIYIWLRLCLYKIDGAIYMMGIYSNVRVLFPIPTGGTITAISSIPRYTGGMMHCLRINRRNRLSAPARKLFSRARYSPPRSSLTHECRLYAYTDWTYRENRRDHVQRLAIIPACSTGQLSTFTIFHSHFYCHRYLYLYVDTCVSSCIVSSSWIGRWNGMSHKSFAR